MKRTLRTHRERKYFGMSTRFEEEVTATVGDDKLAIEVRARKWNDGRTEFVVTATHLNRRDTSPTKDQPILNVLEKFEGEEKHPYRTVFLQEVK